MKKSLSVVIPVYNEEKQVQNFFARFPAVRRGLEQQFDLEVSLLLVNDGSIDTTSEAILVEAGRYRIPCTVIELARNVGQQRAILAGLDHLETDCAVIMDFDLQDAPEYIEKMVAYFEKGIHLVRVQRTKRRESLFFKFWYFLFSRLIQTTTSITPKTGTFSLLSRKAYLALREYKEKHIYFPGLLDLIGFDTVFMPAERAERKYDKSRVGYKKLFRLGFDAIFSFSFFPLRVFLYLGVVISTLSFFLVIMLVIMRLVYDHTLPGWTSTMIVLCFLIGMLSIGIGVLGEYVGRIYEEVKRRPLFHVKEIKIGNSDAG